eukprot:1194537-Prorocentrum_minimum.AAC.8
MLCVTCDVLCQAELMITALGLDGYFDILVIGEECARAKPFPDPYQAALKHFNLDPTQAIVFEVTHPHQCNIPVCIPHASACDTRSSGSGSQINKQISNHHIGRSKGAQQRH